MHSEERTPRPSHGKLKIAAVLGAAALAVPGAGIVGNAIAAGGDSAPAPQHQAPGPGIAAPVQAQDEDGRDRGGPDGRDCPEKDGSGGGSGSGGSGSGVTSADTAV
jgi:hypothetical protein